MPGRYGPRGLVAALAIAAALVVGAVGVWSVVSYHLRWSLHPALTQILRTPPLHTAHRALPTQGVDLLEIESTSGDVSVDATNGPDLALSWTVPGNPRTALSVIQSGATLTVEFRPPDSTVVIGGEDMLHVAVPSGLKVDIAADSGDTSVTGRLRDLSISSASGDVSVQDFQGRLTARADSGDLDVRDAEIAGPLRLSDSSGDISFTGNPGLAASVQADSGDVDLALRPAGRLAVRISVPSGSASSSIGALTGNADGTRYWEAIGRGRPGSLDIVASSGDVTLSPQNP